MDPIEAPAAPAPEPEFDPSPDPAGESTSSALSRRGFLTGAVIAGGGLVAATIASCVPATAPNWTYGPVVTRPAAGSAAPASAAPASTSC
jgi:hypothetical protein